MGTRAIATEFSTNASDKPSGTRTAPLGFSFFVTAVVVLLPTAIVALAVRLTAWTPNTATMWVTTGSLSAGLLIVGTQWWMRQPGSTTMSFGELMLWRWFRRRHAEEVLMEGTRLLEPTDALSRNGQLEMLRELNAALEVRDPYTSGHSRRVERHAYRTALAMHMSVEDIFNLRVAASLHDIGKINVPIEVIRKQGPLTDHEWVLMKKHPGDGAKMIAHIGHESLVNAVRYHHERWDGGGYPDGIAGDDIPLQARIIAVCDTFDAITSTRSYRAKSSREEAIAIIKKNSGSQFDPAVVDAFLSALPQGVPGVAALSALSVPALQKGLSQAASLFREAGLAGLAGAIATSGVTGAVAASAVNPAKYLNRPALVRSQGSEHAHPQARERASDRSVIAIGGAGTTGATSSTYSAKSRSLGAPTDRSSVERSQQGAGSTREQAPGNSTKGQGKGKPDEPKSNNGNGGLAAADATQGNANGATKGESKAGAAGEKVKDTVDEVETVVEDAAEDVPPGQDEKKEPPVEDNADEIVSETVEGGSTDAADTKASKGKGKPK